MTLRAQALAAVALAAGLALATNAQTVPPSAAGSSSSVAQIQFSYENPGLDPAKFTLAIGEDGKGHYTSVPREAPATLDSIAAARDMKTLPQDRDIVVSAPTREFLFGLARSRHFFSTPCDYGKGKIAFQGKKVLSYVGTDGSGSCTYNWSNDPQMEKLTRILEGMSRTLEAGQLLKMEHQHDRLSMDKEIADLAADVKDGRACELQNIADELEAITKDESVMQRARSRASILLQGIAPPAN